MARSLVFDTQDVLITGKGNIDLGTEQLDLTLNGQPKKLRLVRVRSPIEIAKSSCRSSMKRIGVRDSSAARRRCSKSTK